MTTALRAIERKDDAIGHLYDQEAEQTALAHILDARYRAMLRAVHNLLGDVAFGQRESFRLTDADVEELLQVAAEQVVRIDTATRAAIREQLTLGERLGLSAWEIAYGRPDIGYGGLEHLFTETWRGRAETIARNELLESAHVASLNRYRASGLVDRVRAHDGDKDNLCAPRNGRVYPIEDAPSRAHINCSLVLVPLLREGVI